VQIVVGNLAQNGLGVTIGNLILIDADAAGYGWFVNGSLQARVDSGRMDLLTVVAHELGNAMGIPEDAGATDAVTSPILEAGARHLPGSSLAAPAVPATTFVARNLSLTDVARAIANSSQARANAVKSLNGTQPVYSSVLFTGLGTAPVNSAPPSTSPSAPPAASVVAPTSWQGSVPLTASMPAVQTSFLQGRKVETVWNLLCDELVNDLTARSIVDALIGP
jgi:hypothetical protein